MTCGDIFFVFLQSIKVLYISDCCDLERVSFGCGRDES